MNNAGAVRRKPAFSQLESRRILCEVERASLTREIESSKTGTPAHGALVRRRDDLLYELEQIKREFQHLRAEQQAHPETGAAKDTTSKTP